jgi:hypothetical protein
VFEATQTRRLHRQRLCMQIFFEGFETADMRAAKVPTGKLSVNRL